MEKINYEQSVKRLEEITTALESGNITLDESIKLYSEGVKLAEKCQKALNEAQIKITKLSADSGEDDE